MDLTKIIITVIIVSLLSGVLGGLIAVFSKIFKVNDNAIETEVFKKLPGYNCGACGKAGCKAFAKAIIEENEDINKCRPMKREQKEELAKYLNSLK